MFVLLLLRFVVSRKADNPLSGMAGKMLANPNKLVVTVRQTAPAIDPG